MVVKSRKERMKHEKCRFVCFVTQEIKSFVTSTGQFGTYWSKPTLSNYPLSFWHID